MNLSASAISDFSLGQRAVTGAMHRIFKYRLYPNRKQRMMLDTHLMLCRELYNAGLQERIESTSPTFSGFGALPLTEAIGMRLVKVSPHFKLMKSGNPLHIS